MPEFSRSYGHVDLKMNNSLKSYMVNGEIPLNIFNENWTDIEKQQGKLELAGIYSIRIVMPGT